MQHDKCRNRVKQMIKQVQQMQAATNAQTGATNAYLDRPNKCKCMMNATTGAIPAQSGMWHVGDLNTKQW